MPRQVYIAWLPSVLRTICRTLLIILVNLLSVLLFDLTMVLSGSKMHSGLATLLCFLTFQSILIALIYSTLESLSRPPAAAVISGVLLYFWIVLPGNLADNATPYIIKRRPLGRAESQMGYRNLVRRYPGAIKFRFLCAYPGSNPNYYLCSCG